MYVVERIGHERRLGRVRASARALCNAWAAYTLKRAIADVASTSEHDYTAFGLDKDQILAALAQLRTEIAARGRPAARQSHGNGNCGFVIMVAKRRPGRAGELQ